MPFAIVADLPLGTYHGAGQDGQPEPVPSVARLHAALLCAAGFGPRAVSTGPDSLDVREEDQAALRWLEENPPDSVAIPALQINIAYPVAYRDDGTIKRSRASASIKKLAKSPGGGTAVAGRFAWIWTEPPPPDICGSLAELCPDVAYLGTTESPARLRAVTGEKIEATADLDATAGMFSTAVTALARPARGRTAELMAAHQDASGRPPSVAADKVKTDEKSLSPVPRRAAVATARYRDRARPAVQAPWQRAIVLPLDRVIGEEYRVGWAVAAHRALVRLIGYGAPPLVTGAYPPGTRQAREPARLARPRPGDPRGTGPAPRPGRPSPVRSAAARARWCGCWRPGRARPRGGRPVITARPGRQHRQDRPGSREGASRRGVLAAAGTGPGAGVGDQARRHPGHARQPGLDIRRRCPAVAGVRLEGHVDGPAAPDAEPGRPVLPGPR